METKWTPGPWRVVKDSRHVVDVFAGDRDVVSVYGGGAGLEYRDANAHLIAAAPDLYAALVDANRLLGDIPAARNNQRVVNAIQANRAALAKARGEA